MLIELRKLKVIKALSEETSCYTAEIWIDGALAFLASNRGHGGADDFRQKGTLTEAEVDQWLKAHRTARTYQGIDLDPSLENEVAEKIDVAESVSALRRRLRTNIVTIEDGAVYSYPLKKRPPDPVIAAIRIKRPAAEILNGADDARLLAAARLILDADNAASGSVPL
ncbi:MAG TPA: hypothetical protein VF503_15015 [Sphingobium sp.]|uniref:hypothetical protein n=1 Tax=Sphingobium sp. TaxID=1912891 RepID=UPI002ED39690